MHIAAPVPLSSGTIVAYPYSCVDRFDLMNLGIGIILGASHSLLLRLLALCTHRRCGGTLPRHGRLTAHHAVTRCWRLRRDRHRRQRLFRVSKQHDCFALQHFCRQNAVATAQFVAAACWSAGGVSHPPRRRCGSRCQSLFVVEQGHLRLASAQ